MFFKNGEVPEEKFEDFIKKGTMLAEIDDANFCEFRVRQLCAFAKEVILLGGLVLPFQKLFSKIFKKR